MQKFRVSKILLNVFEKYIMLHLFNNNTIKKNSIVKYHNLKYAFSISK